MSIDAIRKQLSTLTINHMHLRDNEYFRDQIISKYTAWVIQSLNKILDDSPSSNPIDGLTHFLNENWTLVKGTLLSPTALPNADVTELLLSIAVFVSNERNKTLAKDEAPIEALQLLMPSLMSLNSYNPRYPDLTGKDVLGLKHVLGTHILSSNQTYLLPISLVTELDEYTNLSTVCNPFFDISIEKKSDEEATKAILLTTDECERLASHSMQTRAVCDAKTIYDHSIAKNSSSLLGQLHALCLFLKNNSRELLGNELNAGTGAYLGIISFLDFYNRLSPSQKDIIPQNLKAEIDYLIDIASDKDRNIEAGVNRCVASRRNKIMAAMKNSEELLNSITLDDSSKAQLRESLSVGIGKAKEGLLHAIDQREALHGYDHLGINGDLLRFLDLTFNLSSLSQLEMVHTLSPQEMCELLDQPEVIQNIIKRIKTPDELFMILKDFSDDKTSLFLNALLKCPQQNLIKNPQHLAILLINSDIEKCRAIIKGYGHSLYPMLKQGFDGHFDRSFSFLQDQLPFEKLYLILQVIHQVSPKDPFVKNQLLKEAQKMGLENIIDDLMKNHDPFDLLSVLKSQGHLSTYLFPAGPPQTIEQFLKITHNLPHKLLIPFYQLMEGQWEPLLKSVSDDDKKTLFALIRKDVSSGDVHLFRCISRSMPVLLKFFPNKELMELHVTLRNYIHKVAIGHNKSKGPFEELDLPTSFFYDAMDFISDGAILKLFLMQFSKEINAHFNKQSVLFAREFCQNPSDTRFHHLKSRFEPDISLGRKHAQLLMNKVFEKCKALGDCEAHQGLLRDCVNILNTIKVYRRYSNGVDRLNYFDSCLQKGYLYNELKKMSVSKKTSVAATSGFFAPVPATSNTTEALPEAKIYFV